MAALSSERARLSTTACPHPWALAPTKNHAAQVYLKMLAHTDAARVRERMHGRYFAKARIICDPVEEAAYDRKFSLSRA